MILLVVGPAPGALSAPEIVRTLAGTSHRVEVILQPRTGHYIGPAALAGIAEVVETPSEVPEAVIVAPADTGTLARVAHGLGSDPLPASIGTGRCPVFVVPDLDAATAGHPAVKRNLEVLEESGVRVVGGTGGGMASAGEIVAEVLGGLGGPLSGLRVLVTAGGTREPIDSVRFVGNRSSGKMGAAVAREARRLGAGVDVIAANVEIVEPGVGWFPVETVDELREKVMELAEEADVLVMAAAVSDFKPASPLKSKVRRREGLRVEFVATDDILKTVRDENPDLFVVGFAATHGDPVADAREKLASKGADLVVGNDISRADIGFGAEENEVYVVGRDGETFVSRSSKREVARAILDALIAEMNKEKQT